MKTTAILAIALACSSALFATDKDKPTAPIVIPLTGSGQATTSKLGNSYITRASGGQSFTTTQLGSSTVTRDSKGNTWTTTQLGNSYVTRGPDGQQQTTTKLGNSYITRDSKTGSTRTTSPAWNLPPDPQQLRRFLVHLATRFLARHKRQFLIGKEGRQGNAGHRHSGLKVEGANSKSDSPPCLRRCSPCRQGQSGPFARHYPSVLLVAGFL
jgi:hypothetical protein